MSSISTHADVGLLDTSVALMLGSIPAEQLPEQSAIASLTLAELAAGPQATSDPALRALRQTRLQTIESTFDVLPFDVACARVWPRVYAAMIDAERKPRGRRVVDLMIATTALANGLEFYTANPRDFDHLRGLLDIHPVTAFGA